MFSEGENRRHAMAHVRREIQRAGGPKEVKKEELEDMVDSLGIEVERSDGKDGEPTKDDLLDAIGL